MRLAIHTSIIDWPGGARVAQSCSDAPSKIRTARLSARLLAMEKTDPSSAEESDGTSSPLLVYADSAS